MASAGMPAKRLRCKTSLKPPAGPRSIVQKIKSNSAGPRSTVHGPRSKPQNDRSRAIQQGLIPKARKAFALFLQENSKVDKGASREAFAQDMKNMGQLWAALPDDQKKAYRERSLQEVATQHAAMMRLGLHVRQPCHASQAQGPRSTVHGPNPEGADSRPSKFKIGPYTVVDTVGGHVLGGGSYGKVFCSMGEDGRTAAIKLFRKRDGMDDAKHEADLYRRISQLASAHQRWFPQMLASNICGDPFPWVAISFEGNSLHAWLSANGPFAQECVRPFALQLEAAIQTLHIQACLLHLDIKPGNILWCPQLTQLKLCDFGLSEPFAGVVENPRFSEYTSQPYRAPELWHVTGDLRSLQKALTPAVDQWAFGAVLFEVCSGFMLMKPFDRQKSTKQTITDWCAHWADASSCCGARTGPKKSNHWSTRLLHCSRWGPLVVQACHPEARSRKWMKNRK